MDRALELDVLRSCRWASEVVVVGEAWDRTGDAEDVLRLKEGEVARKLVGELDADIA